MANFQYCEIPEIPTELNLNAKDRCYLYRAISQNETKFAIDWMTKWKDISLTDENDQRGVLWQCIIHKNQELINYLLANKLANIEQVIEFQRSNNFSIDIFK